MSSQYLRTPPCRVASAFGHNRTQLAHLKANSRAHGRHRSSQLSITAVAKGKELVPPYNVVVTGSTKGIGRALAEEFIKYGDNVLVCSRTDDGVKAAVRELESRAKSLGTGSRVKGLAVNVAKAANVASLANFARDQFGTIDFWINNAGSNAYKYDSLVNFSDADLAEIVETNVLGTMYGCKEAMRVMKDQEAGGHIFIMEGAGSDGTATPRFAAYGATKRGLNQLSSSLRAELKTMGVNNIGIHNVSPGMVTTDLLMSGADTAKSKFFINAIAEKAEDSAAFLVPKIRKVPQETRALGGGISGGAKIRFLTKPKAYRQILARLLLGARKNKWVPED